VMAVYWLRAGRDAPLYRIRRTLRTLVRLPLGDTIVPEYEPPADMSPAELGALVDGIARTRHVTATLIDLAIRGHIAIREVAERGWVLTKLKAPETLVRSFEQTFVSSLFESGDDVELGKVNDALYSVAASTELDLDDDLVGKGWFR